VKVICPSSVGSPTQFSFPLIPLPEAARIQAQRRADGEDDQTFLGSSYVGNSARSSRVASRNFTGRPLPALIKACVRNKPGQRRWPASRLSQSRWLFHFQHARFPRLTSECFRSSPYFELAKSGNHPNDYLEQLQLSTTTTNWYSHWRFPQPILCL
jgi:hypothetical protein